MKLTDFLNAINYTKDPIMDTDDDWVEKKYPAFVVNRCLSYFPDTILQCNNMNMRPHIDNKMQFEYYRLSTRKRKRFSKWLKDEQSSDFDIVKEYFGYNNRKTKEVMDILTAQDISSIRSDMNTGG